MEHQNYKIHSDIHNDPRFGLIQVYSREGNVNDLIFSKNKVSKRLAENNCFLELAYERQKYDQKYLLPLVQVENDEEALTVCTYFYYPNTDLHDRFSRFKEPLEMFRFLHDILKSLSFLEKRSLVHGNVRPELIYYNKITKNYVLVDRLNEHTTPMESQRNSIKSEMYLYSTPEIFNILINETVDTKYDPYKSECFSVGMILLSAVVSNELYMSIYNIEEQCFNFEKFQQAKAVLMRLFEVESDFESIGRYINDVMLSPEEAKRKRPAKTLSLLKEIFCKTSFANKILSERKINDSFRNSDKSIRHSSKTETKRRQSPMITRIPTIVEVNESERPSLNDLETMETPNDRRFSIEEEHVRTFHGEILGIASSLTPAISFSNISAVTPVRNKISNSLLKDFGDNDIINNELEIVNNANSFDDFKKSDNFMRDEKRSRDTNELFRTDFGNQIELHGISQNSLDQKGFRPSDLGGTGSIKRDVFKNTFDLSDNREIFNNSLDTSGQRMTLVKNFEYNQGSLPHTKRTFEDKKTAFQCY